MEITPATVEKSEKQNETPTAEKQITEEDVTSTKDVAAGDASNNNKSGYYQKKRPYNPAHKRYAIPWVTKFPMALHEEIWSFSQWLTPTTEEQTMRQDVVNRLRKIVEKLWPEATVVPYGSFETNLCVPTSDIDVVIFGAQPIDDKSPLSILAEALEQEELPSKPPKVISSAKVPIVKFHDRKSGCLVDISFDITTGIANTKIIKEFLNQYPLLRPLALVIKFYLKQRYLNDTWSGGIGSYTLIMMIISYLQLHTKSKGQIPHSAPNNGEVDANNNNNNNNNNANNNNNNNVPPPHDETKEDMASMLTGFFELYGSKFDYLTNVISILDGGKYFSKEEKKWTHSDALDALAVEDPQNPDNDVGLACFKIKEAKQAFADAFATLTGPKKYLSESLLGKLVRVPLSLVQQRQRMKSSGNRELTDETPAEVVIETQGDLDTEEKRLSYNYQNRYKSYARNNDGWYHNKTPSSSNTNQQSSHRAEAGTDSTTQRTSNNNNTTQGQSYLPPHRRQQQARAPAPANTHSTASSTVSSASTSPTNSTLLAISVPLVVPALNDKTATHGSNNNNNNRTAQQRKAHQTSTNTTHHGPRNNNSHHLTTHKTSNSAHQNSTSHSPASTSPRVTSSNNPSNTPVHSGNNSSNNNSNNRQNNSGQNRSGSNNNTRSNNNRNNNNNNRGRSNNNNHNNNANVHEDDEIKNDEQNFPSLSKDPTVHENKIAQKASDTTTAPNIRPQHVNNNTINGNNAAGQQNGSNKGNDGKKGGKRRQNTVLISA